MARDEQLVTDDRVIEDRRRGGAGRTLMVLLAVVALAVVAFFAFGGSADVDTEGDLEVPEVDVDVNVPNVDVDSSGAPPASADAG
ncbi:MAG: hypothetical protein ACT452_03315 [Microthrixaceae bacterium]